MQAETGKVHHYDPDGLVLRLRSVIQDKSAKLGDYVRDKIIQQGQATVIAISSVTLPSLYRYTGRTPPEIVRAVYPVNNPVIDVSHDATAHSKPSLEYRDLILKRNGSDVRTDIFLNPEFAHVSSVLYSEGNWVNEFSQPGAEFKIVHNPNAVAPLQDGWFPAGDEYRWRDGERVQHLRHG
jgi:hypothetical protein